MRESGIFDCAANSNNNGNDRIGSYCLEFWLVGALVFATDLPLQQLTWQPCVDQPVGRPFEALERPWCYGSLDGCEPPICGALLVR